MIADINQCDGFDIRFMRGDRTEHDHILGDMLERASALGVSTPVLRIADTILRAYEMTRS